MSDPLDLDLIGMVQQARIAHEAEAAPSQVASLYWLEARDGGQNPPATERAGCWSLLTTLASIDAQWNVIKKATEAGQLGYKAKTSGRGHATERVIQVMTYDAGDAADVARVRAALDALGFDGGWVYQRG